MFKWGKVNHNGKKATKIDLIFSLSFLKLHYISEWEIQNVYIVCGRKSRKITSELKSVVTQCGSNNCYATVCWSVPENLSVTSTLYEEIPGKYENKEWRFEVIHVSTKGHKRKLAWCPINVAEFVGDNPKEVSLGLRPSSPLISSGTLTLMVFSSFVESGVVSDVQSQNVSTTEDKVNCSSKTSHCSPSITQQNAAKDTSIDSTDIHRTDDFDSGIKRNSFSVPSQSSTQEGEILFQHEGGDYKDESLSKNREDSRDSLLAWLTAVLQNYSDLSQPTLKFSYWRDGLAFCAIINHFYPQVISYKSLLPVEIKGNCSLSLKFFSDIGISTTLDAKQLAMFRTPSPDLQLELVNLLYSIKSHFLKEPAYSKLNIRDVISSNNNSICCPNDNNNASERRRSLSTSCCFDKTEIFPNNIDSMNASFLDDACQSLSHHSKLLAPVKESNYVKQKSKQKRNNLLRFKLKAKQSNDNVDVVNDGVIKDCITRSSTAKSRFFNPFDSDEEDLGSSKLSGSTSSAERSRIPSLTSDTPSDGVVVIEDDSQSDIQRIQLKHEALKRARLLSHMHVNDSRSEFKEDTCVSRTSLSHTSDVAEVTTFRFDEEDIRREKEEEVNSSILTYPISKNDVMDEYEKEEAKLEELNQLSRDLEARMRSEEMSPKVENALVEKWFYVINRRNSLLNRMHRLHLMDEENSLVEKQNSIRTRLRSYSELMPWQKDDVIRKREDLLLEKLLSNVNKRNDILEEIDKSERTILVNMDTEKSVAKKLKRDERCVVM